MVNYLNTIGIIITVYYIITKARGTPVENQKIKSCIKKYKSLDVLKRNYHNCLQKCLWEEEGLIRNGVLNIHSSKFKNLLHNDVRKTRKFVRCLRHFRIRRCNDMAKVNSCYMSVKGKTRSIFSLSGLEQAAQKTINNVGTMVGTFAGTIASVPSGIAHGVKKIASVPSGIAHGVKKNVINPIKSSIIHTAANALSSASAQAIEAIAENFKDNLGPSTSNFLAILGHIIEFFPKSLSDLEPYVKEFVNLPLLVNSVGTLGHKLLEGALDATNNALPMITDGIEELAASLAIRVMDKVTPHVISHIQLAVATLVEDAKNATITLTPYLSDALDKAADTVIQKYGTVLSGFVPHIFKMLANFGD